MTSTATDIIARLELRPHPEGGHYRETFRDKRVDANGRALLVGRGQLEAVRVGHEVARAFTRTRGDLVERHRRARQRSSVKLRSRG